MNDLTIFRVSGINKNKVAAVYSPQPQSYDCEFHPYGLELVVFAPTEKAEYVRQFYAASGFTVTEYQPKAVSHER